MSNMETKSPSAPVPVSVITHNPPKKSRVEAVIDWLVVGWFHSMNKWVIRLGKRKPFDPVSHLKTPHINN